MSRESNVTRRQFLSQSAAGALALGVGSSTLLSPHSAVAGANDRINVGCIGIGGMGGGHLSALVRDAKTLNIRIAAICDIYTPRKQAAVAKAQENNPDVVLYHEYRDLLADPRVDAVWVTTPDHWHAQMAIDAMLAGKDVYCEKPMTHTWQEAREMHRVWQQTGRVVQVGSQSCSDVGWTTVHRLIEEGKIGQPIWGQVSWGRNQVSGDWNYGTPPNAEKDIDWKRFLGPAPQRAFEPDRFFNFRKYWDYSGGIATDLFAHSLHSMCKGIGPHFPMRATAGGGIWMHDDREVPDTFHMIVDYPEKYSIVALGSQANAVGLETIIRGNEMTLYMGDHSKIVLKPEGPYRKQRKEEEILIEPSGQGNQDVHRKNFLDCVRSRNQQTNCSPDLGYKVTVALSLAVDAFRYKQVKEFDPIRHEEITTGGTR